MISKSKSLKAESFFLEECQEENSTFAACFKRSIDKCWLQKNKKSAISMGEFENCKAPPCREFFKKLFRAFRTKL